MKNTPTKIYLDPRIAAQAAQEPDEVLGRGDQGPVCYIRSDEVQRRINQLRQVAAGEFVVQLSGGAREDNGTPQLFALTNRGRLFEFTTSGWAPFPSPLEGLPQGGLEDD